MTPVTPSTTSSTSLVPRPVFISRNVNCSSRSCILRKLYAQKLVLPLSTSLRLFPSIRTCVLHRNPQTHIVSAAGTEVAVEEADSPVVDKDSSEPITTPAAADAGPARVQPKRSGQGRKSEMPPVKNEDLVAGASFTGKVRSIQPFGAFIDFGAFTDGLVHVSQLSNSFVKDVNSIVSIGQEVTVRLVDANFETGRISLTMRDSDDTNKSPVADTDRPPRPQRKTGQKPGQRKEKASKFVKGQNLVGTVKNITRSGAFITLPEGEEGFLPSSEEPDDGLGSMMMGSGSSLEAGQEVNVRVLRITRGQLTLTMKKEEDVGSVDSSLSQGTVHTATNPFLLAFRQNKEIATFLDEREKEVGPTSNDDLDPVASEDIVAAVDQKTEEADSTVEIGSEAMAIETPSVESVVAADQTTEAADPTIETESEGVADNVAAVDQITEETDSTVEIKSEGVAIETPSVESVVAAEQITEAADPTIEIESEGVADNVAAVDQITEETDSTVEIESEGVAIETPSMESEAAVDQITESADPTVEIESEEESDKAIVEVESKIPSSTLVEDKEIDTPQSQESTIVENQINEVAENQIEVKDELPNETPNVENGNVPVPEEKTAKVTISPALVKQLREETGAGMMDCKNALSSTGGDIIKAQEYLRKKGLASADKKAARVTAEGRIGSYIHDSRIGVLIEVNCETDFVSRGEIFKELVDDLAMQVAACPQVQYLTTDDVAEEFVEKEKEIEMQKEDLLSKPEQIRAKIVEGRIRKRIEELALLEQPYIKNDKVVVKDWVKQKIATVGENIKVKRFVRFNLGEGLEKKSQDFAAEVAAQTAAKTVKEPVKEPEPAAEVEAKEVVDKPPKPAISAALVKQLREETGAGMMDCKKALAETDGNLEKAQEYLRKKGLSTADKKSSRLAAEGRIGLYIHDSRIGVLIEVNCETDFVGRSEKFKELADDLAMQVVACPNVEYVSIEDIPESVKIKEKELEMQREDILSKPESIRERIVEGRVSKRLGEMALLEQSFIKDDSVAVKDLVKQTVAALGENIKVRRFVRFTLGEDN